MREFMLIVHFIGLAMGVGTSFANMFLGIAASKLEREDAAKLGIHSLALTKMGHIGLGLLIISGVYLIIPYWSTLAQMPFLHVKLLMVLILIILVGVLTMKGKKAKAGDFSQFPKMAIFGRLALLTSLTIITLAVLAFH